MKTFNFFTILAFSSVILSISPEILSVEAKNRYYDYLDKKQVTEDIQQELDEAEIEFVQVDSKIAAEGSLDEDSGPEGYTHDAEGLTRPLVKRAAVPAEYSAASQEVPNWKNDNIVRRAKEIQDNSNIQDEEFSQGSYHGSLPSTEEFYKKSYEAHHMKIDLHHNGSSHTPNSVVYPQEVEVESPGTKN